MKCKICVFLRKVWEDVWPPLVFFTLMISAAIIVVAAIEGNVICRILVSAILSYILIVRSVQWFSLRWRESQSECDDAPEWREARLDGDEDG